MCLKNYGNDAYYVSAVTIKMVSSLIVKTSHPLLKAMLVYTSRVVTLESHFLIADQLCYTMVKATEVGIQMHMSVSLLESNLSTTKILFCH